MVVLGLQDGDDALGKLVIFIEACPISLMSAIEKLCTKMFFACLGDDEMAVIVLPVYGRHSVNSRSDE